MNKRLLIIGAGGHGRVAADIALKMGKWDSISFLDDDERKKTSLKVEVIGGLDEAYYYFKESDFFVAIGDNGKRKTIQLLEQKHLWVLVQ
jgi:D-arabinose 1-dehydrogenase-like Zn-dependent alcohol dehydrogenase